MAAADLSSLSGSSLFNCNNIVAVITGGGTGMHFISNKYNLI